MLLNNSIFLFLFVQVSLKPQNKVSMQRYHLIQNTHVHYSFCFVTLAVSLMNQERMLSQQYTDNSVVNKFSSLLIFIIVYSSDLENLQFQIYCVLIFIIISLNKTLMSQGWGQQGQQQGWGGQQQGGQQQGWSGQKGVQQQGAWGQQGGWGQQGTQQQGWGQQGVQQQGAWGQQGVQQQGAWGQQGSWGQQGTHQQGVPQQGAWGPQGTQGAWGLQGQQQGNIATNIGTGTSGGILGGLKNIFRRQKNANGKFKRAYYSLRSVHSGRVLDIAQDGPYAGTAIQWDGYAGDNQCFGFVQQGPDYYIKCKQNNLYLTVENNQNGARIFLSPKSGNVNQKFRVDEKQGSKDRVIYTFCGKCLDVLEGKKENGARISQYDYNGNSNQLWNFCDPKDITSSSSDHD